MANGRIKIANNIDQVAQDIISYIFPYLKSPAEKRRHRNQLSAIFQEVLVQYQAPLIAIPFISYIETHYVNPYFRQRSLEIAATGRLIKESEDDERHIILHAITLMLEHGKCESTSANTLLLDLLIKQLNKYEPINEDERFANGSWKAYGSRLGIRETLRDAFVKKAKVIMENWESGKKEKAKLPTPDLTPKERAPLKIDSAFLEQLSLFRTGKSLSKSPTVKAKREIEAEIKSFEREEIISPEQVAWVGQKHVIGQIEDYKPKKVKEEREVRKLDLSKLSDVVEKLNAMNKKKAAVVDPGLLIQEEKMPVVAKKVGKIKDRAEFSETIKLLEEHARARFNK